MPRKSDPINLGWGNQPRVTLQSSGAITAEGAPDVPFRPDVRADLLRLGDGLYKMACIVDDQVRNPFSEARVPVTRLEGVFFRIEELLTAALNDLKLEKDEVSRVQLLQVVASGGLVALSIAERCGEVKNKTAERLQRRVMEWSMALVDAGVDSRLTERQALNQDWVIPSLAPDLKDSVKASMARALPLEPPYADWFREGTTLRISWKTGSEFMAGWHRRLQEDGFERARDGGLSGESLFRRSYEFDGVKTDVEMTLAPERQNLFERMDDPSIHIVGYDGHSDWGRVVRRAFGTCPPQAGEKAIFYFLCCGKQTLQAVRDHYPKAQVVTTFNSSRFTPDLKYSEDYSALMNILEAMAKRRSWDGIRKSVNLDWYHNPEKNYLFPAEALSVGRCLDQDHDGQADIFDRLYDFNPFAIPEDTHREFTPIIPETPSSRIVGTRLHAGVQVFHTLCHFNQYLKGFSQDLRVFADGFFAPDAPLLEQEQERGAARVRVEIDKGQKRYFLRGDCRHAHASEDAWRVLILAALAPVVMAQEPASPPLSAEDRALNTLLLVAQCISVDSSLSDRDEAIWTHLLEFLNLPSIDRWLVMRAKGADAHWYSGSAAGVAALKEGFSADTLTLLRESLLGR